jgi:hypothetical protein
MPIKDLCLEGRQDWLFGRRRSMVGFDCGGSFGPMGHHLRRAGPWAALALLANASW